MINRLLIILVLISGNLIYAQKNDCKVIRPDLSGTYSGGCKNGLANGKGIAQGTNRYEGQFNKGLPDGKGRFTWANGTYFEGQFRDGMRDGQGKMVYKDSVVNGFWKEDKYVGEKIIAPYTIIRNISVARYTFKKSIESSSGIRVKIMQGGSNNSTIEDFSMAYDSGEEYRMGSVYGVQHTSIPLSVKITYRTWNVFHTTQYSVQFEFILNDPGTWDIVLNN
jgi:hypothetical protein